MAAYCQVYDYVTCRLIGKRLGSALGPTLGTGLLYFRRHVSLYHIKTFGTDIWNSLPVNIRLIDSHPSFSRALKSHLFNIAFS